MEQIMNTLKENSIATIVHKRSDGKYLVCKHSFANGEKSLPVFKIDVNDSEYTLKLIQEIEKEFGVINTALMVISTNRSSYLAEQKFVLGNNIGFLTKELSQYKGKREPVLNVSGFFTDCEYLTLSQINVLFKQGLFDASSFYFINEVVNRGGFLC